MLKIERWESQGHVVFYANSRGKTIILSSGECSNESYLKELANNRLVEFLLSALN